MSLFLCFIFLDFSPLLLYNKCLKWGGFIIYVDYHMINDKETIVNNHKGESIKITGLNQGNIKSLILLSNKIEGLEDKINY